MAPRIISTFNIFNWAAMCSVEWLSGPLRQLDFWSSICIPGQRAGLWGFSLGRLNVWLRSEPPSVIGLIESVISLHFALNYWLHQMLIHCWSQLGKGTWTFTEICCTWFSHAHRNYEHTFLARCLHFITLTVNLLWFVKALLICTRMVLEKGSQYSAGSLEAAELAAL